MELWLFFITLGGFILGGTSISLVRTEMSPGRVLWGRRLFIAILLFLGGTGLLAALQRADGLIPLGLLAGLLLVAMLWESPLAEKVPG